MTNPGTVIAIGGGIAFLVGFVWLHIRGFKDGAFPEINLFVTGVSLIAYVVTRWGRAKLPTLLALGGLAALFVGASIPASQQHIEIFHQGVAALERDDCDRAVECFSEAIRLAPELSEAYYNRGGAYCAKGDLDKAISDFTEFIRLEPQDADGYQARAAVYEQQGEKAKAEEDRARARECAGSGMGVTNREY